LRGSVGPRAALGNSNAADELALQSRLSPGSLL
jgi:hypothetical protein